MYDGFTLLFDEHGAEFLFGVEGETVEERGLGAEFGDSQGLLGAVADEGGFHGFADQLPVLWGLVGVFDGDVGGEKDVTQQGRDSGSALRFVRNDNYFRDLHFGLGEGAGFVGEDEVGGAEAFCGDEFADHALAFSEAFDADGKDDGEGDRQAFRDGGNRDRDGDQEHVESGLAAGETDGKEDGDEDAKDDAHLDGKVRDGFLKRRGFAFLIGDEAGDLAKFGAVTGGGDQDIGNTFYDEGAAVDHAGSIAHHGRGFEFAGGFFDGERFAGEDGFVDFEVVGVEDAAVGGDAVALGEVDDIAGDEFARIDFKFVIVTTNTTAGANVAFETFEHGFCFVFLPVAKGGIDENSRKDDAAIDPFLENERDNPGAKEDQNQGAFELFGDDAEMGKPLLGRDLIESDAGLASFCFF